MTDEFFAEDEHRRNQLPFFFDMQDKRVKHPEFASEIDHWGYEWMPYTVTTRDGYQLTLFRIIAGPPDDFVRPEIPPEDDKSKRDPSWGIEEPHADDQTPLDMGSDVEHSDGEDSS